ncbi:hypothetical protein K525DRAFT_265267 [Schizophyllum commune Loenen D]|nr:hypothetical protein K525DRAFT_265267 [Schizophyllum commune Loenen D]
MDSVKRMFQKAIGFVLGCQTEAAEPARSPDRSWEATDGSQLVDHQIHSRDAISRTDKSKTRSHRSVPVRDWPHASAVPPHWQHGAAPSSEGVVADTFSGPAEEKKKDIKSPAGVCDRAAAAEERLAAAECKIQDLCHDARARDSEVARLSDQLQGAELDRQNQQQHLRHLERTLRSTETSLRDLVDRHRRETEIRQLETEVARRFLQRSDSLSETDVKNQVVKLNEEVFQIAASRRGRHS